MGTEFMNSLFSELTRILKIQHSHSTPYHPETIGSLERNHRVLNEYLRSYVNDELNNWDDYVKFYEFCYNTTPYSTTGYAPYELVYGKKVKLPIDLRKDEIEPVYNVENYLAELKFKLQTAHARAKKLLEKDKENRKNNSDLKMKGYIKLEVGNEVLLESFNRNKLQPLRKGPYVIVQLDLPNVIIKDKNTNATKVVHRNLLTKI